MVKKDCKPKNKKVNGYQMDGKRIAKVKAAGEVKEEPETTQTPNVAPDKKTNRPDLEESIGRGVFGMVGRK